MDVEPGKLLVATAELLDPNFAGTVVYLIEAGADGALGVVLNHPTNVPFPEALAGWSTVANQPRELYRGGPVSLDGALALACAADPDAEPLGWRRIRDRVGLLDLDAPAEVSGPALQGLRIFAGYAGWGAGQLESEIEEGSWYVVDSRVSDVFRTDTDDLRADVLRRQPGQLAWHLTRPADPTLN